MNEEYSKEFFWDTYKKLPEDLKEALFADKNNEVINHICLQSGLNEEQAASVAKFTGRVLMGLLPLDELPITIELELNISQDLASQINRQIYISIFKHLRVSLNKINDKNFNYKDLFTSDSDGKEEYQKRREEAVTPRPISKPFAMPRTPAIATPATPPVFNIEKKEAPIIKDQPIIQPKEPPFSYNEKDKAPALEIEAVPQDTIITPEIKNEPIKQEALSEPIAPNPPSRSAFEQELKKETIPFPDIPMSFPIDSIPTVVIGKPENTRTPTPIQEIKPQQPTLSPLNEANTNPPAPVTAPKPSPVIIPEVIGPIEKPIAPQEQTNNSDPYKELPI